MRESKTESVIEDGLSYHVTTYSRNNEDVVIWRNNKGQVHRVGKPAVLSYTCLGRLKGWMYFNNGKLNSKNEHKAAIYFRSKNFRLWNFKIWAKDGQIHRENKPAITVIERNNANQVFTCLEAYFRNNEPCMRSKASLIFYEHNYEYCYESLNVFLTDYTKVYQNYSGYNLYYYTEKGRLLSKMITSYNIREEIEHFFNELDTLNSSKSKENIEVSFLTLINSIMDIRTLRGLIAATRQHDLPQKVLLHSNEKSFTWMNNNGYHRENNKPARIFWNDREKRMDKFENGIPNEDIFTPYKTITDKQNNIIGFKFFNSELQDFYEKENLNPYNLTKEEKELVELNFLY